MVQPFMGEIRIMSFEFAPSGWARADGQTLLIAQNQTLFSLFGTAYGGDGSTNFCLPDLRGRTPVMIGSGYSLGQRIGEEVHVLTSAELPSHGHVLRASGQQADSGASAFPPGPAMVLAQAYAVQVGGTMVPVSRFSTSPADGALADSAISPAGNDGHENRQPYLPLMFCVSMQGSLPPQG